MSSFYIWFLPMNQHISVWVYSITRTYFASQGPPLPPCLSSRTKMTILTSLLGPKYIVPSHQSFKQLKLIILECSFIDSKKVLKYILKKYVLVLNHVQTGTKIIILAVPVTLILIGAGLCGLANKISTPLLLRGLNCLFILSSACLILN